MKQEIQTILKKCEICQINNRKKKGGSEFVETKMPLEKLAIDLIDLRSDNKFIMVGIDYFTRIAVGEIVNTKSATLISETLAKWIQNGIRPAEIITDNGKEFVSKNFEEICRLNDIIHRKVSIESHRSNGRIERLIGTIREGLVKSKVNEPLEISLDKIIRSYNKTYHSAIKCTPEEAWNDESGWALWQNSSFGDYAKTYRKGFREKFYEGQKVRVAKNENLGSDGKRIKGRFLEEGLVVKECLKDSYLVKINGKIVKKRHCDLKNFKCLSETTRLVRGMSGVNP